MNRIGEWDRKSRNKHMHIQKFSICVRHSSGKAEKER